MDIEKQLLTIIKEMRSFIDTDSKLLEQYHKVLTSMARTGMLAASQLEPSKN